MPRRPINDRPMTPAERKARSRALQLGAVDGQLMIAERDLSLLVRSLKDGAPGMNLTDIRAQIEDALIHVSGARLSLPRS